MEGMCEGEKISVSIPPHLAFEEPGKRFQRSPVPKVCSEISLTTQGATVTYEILVVEIDRPGSLKNRINDAKNFVFMLAPIALFFGVIYAYLKYYYVPSAKGRKTSRRK